MHERKHTHHRPRRVRRNGIDEFALLEQRFEVDEHARGDGALLGFTQRVERAPATVADGDYLVDQAVELAAGGRDGAERIGQEQRPAQLGARRRRCRIARAVPSNVVHKYRSKRIGIHGRVYLLGVGRERPVALRIGVSGGHRVGSAHK